MMLSGSQTDFSNKDVIPEEHICSSAAENILLTHMESTENWQLQSLNQYFSSQMKDK